MTLMAGNDWDSYLRSICLGPQFFLKWHLLGIECPNSSFMCTSDPWVEMIRISGLAGIALSLCILLRLPSSMADLGQSDFLNDGWCPQSECSKKAKEEYQPLKI